MNTLDKINLILNEKEDKESEYDIFFAKLLKKYKVKSPNELDKSTKKKFFQDVEDGWTKEDN